MTAYMRILLNRGAAIRKAVQLSKKANPTYFYAILKGLDGRPLQSIPKQILSPPGYAAGYGWTSAGVKIGRHEEMEAL